MPSSLFNLFGVSPARRWTSFASQQAQAQTAPPRTPPVPEMPRANPVKGFKFAKGPVLLPIAGFVGVAIGLYAYQKYKEKQTQVEVVVKEEEKLSSDHYPFVIVGGGSAGFAALSAIRQRMPSAKVLLVSAEEHLPYQRPPLSKELWLSPASTQGDKPVPVLSHKFKVPETDIVASVYFDEDDDPKALQHNPNTKFLLSTTADKLDLTEKTMELSNGQIIKFDTLCIATGSKAYTVPIVAEQTTEDSDLVVHVDQDKASTSARGVFTLSTLQDFDKITKAASTAKRIALIGGGFLGSELAYALARSPLVQHEGKTVTLLVADQHPLEAVLPPYLATKISKYLSDAGVVIRPKSKVQFIKSNPQELSLVVDMGQAPHTADMVVSCVGSYPDVSLARTASLPVGASGGVTVDAALETKVPGVFVAGDIAELPNPVNGKLKKDCHFDHAFRTGLLAGANMVMHYKSLTTPPQEAKVRRQYQQIPAAYCHIGDLGFEMVGECDSKLETVGVFATPKGTKTTDKGVVYYLDNNKVVVGVLLWNMVGKVTAAKRVLKENKPIKSKADLSKTINVQ